MAQNERSAHLPVAHILLFFPICSESNLPLLADRRALRLGGVTPAVLHLTHQWKVPTAFSPLCNQKLPLWLTLFSRTSRLRASNKSIV